MVAINAGTVCLGTPVPRQNCGKPELYFGFYCIFFGIMYSEHVLAAFLFVVLFVLHRPSNPKAVHHQKEPLLHLTALSDSTVAAVDSWGTFRTIETGLATIHQCVQWVAATKLG